MDSWRFDAAETDIGATFDGKDLKAVAAAQRHGLPGGKCLVCSAKAKRDRWCDQWHFDTDVHRTSMSWAQRQLDNGCLNSEWCAPCGSPVAAAVVGASSSPSSLSTASFSASPVVSATVEWRLQDDGRIAWVKVFHPLGCGADVHVDGAFVVDSFFYFKNKSGKKTEYLPELLAEIRAETGFVFVAVCSGGAALSNPGNGGTYFKQLLAQVPSTARFLISVVCGNDVYNSRFRDSMRFAVDGFCTEARGRFLTHFAVVGMSSATWQYDARHSAQYDADAAALLGAVLASGVSAESGAAEFGGLELSDSIGHVHPNSSSIVFKAYKVWLQKCIDLAVPPPPLPVVRLPLPPCPEVTATLVEHTRRWGRQSVCSEVPATPVAQPLPVCQRCRPHQYRSSMISMLFLQTVRVWTSRAQLLSRLTSRLLCSWLCVCGRLSLSLS